VTLIVAPHFDDAVLSTAHVLFERAPEVTVLTVCAGPPDDGVVSEWDVMCGFTSGTGAAADRAREDLRANALAGARSVHLGLSDGEYRTEFPRELALAELARALQPDGPLWIPSGIGSHPDHIGVRDAVLELIPAASGRVRFYAECPYAFAFGWDAPDDDRDDDHRWGPPLTVVGSYLGTLQPQTVELDDDAMRRKLELFGCHASQVRGMLLELPDLLDFDGPLRREVHWGPDTSSPLAARGSSAMASEPTRGA
jgi:LmbE family N-acetylglucosaminyl deacetylase